MILEPGRKGNSTITFNFNIDDADARVCPLPSLAAATVQLAAFVTGLSCWFVESFILMSKS